MAKDNSFNIFTFHHLCCFLFTISILSPILSLYWSLFPASNSQHVFPTQSQTPSQFHLLSFHSAWNHLSFSQAPPPRALKIALFVKKWPQKNMAGGLERHALTLHLALAKRGHELHIFTTATPNSTLPKYPYKNLHFYMSRPTAAGVLDQALAWNQFHAQNKTQKPFDVVHTESVGLQHNRARGIANVIVSWHGIAYETIHSDIVQELNRNPKEPRSFALTERIIKVVEEVKFFQDYAHHVATSDHVGNVLKSIYMIPEERVHVILNGVNEEIYKPDSQRREEFRRKFGIPESAGLVVGMAGRLVKDKGHPIMFEALKQIFMEEESPLKNVYVLVAGDGPWGARYRDLKPNVLVLGPLVQSQLADFYNALDVFANPTLRAQGLDHILLEAMLSGKAVMATRFSSITDSVIVSPEMGYTFSPSVESLKKALGVVLRDGKEVLEKKGKAARGRALKVFTATKMAAAYERLFLCMSKKERDMDYCTYPLPSDANN
ncbi:hypothetical protein ACLOJK_030146 [Asimina triloba]